jgi:hypothetical protein
MLKTKGFSIISASTLIAFALSILFAGPAMAMANHTPHQGGGSIWCPVGARPKPGKGGCTAAYVNLGALAGALGSVTPANGVIWIEQGVDTDSADIRIDGSLMTGLANRTLTVQGGWTGTPAGHVSGTSLFSSPIYILNWNNVVTVQNITVAHDGGASGLGIVNNGDVHINHFTSDSNVAYGAALYSYNGVITVADSAFTNDGFTGILANAHGDITFTNVTASGNFNNGVEATSPANMVFNCGDASHNGAYGISAVFPTGTLTLNNVSLFGDTAGPYTVTGTLVINPTCP